MVSEKFPHPRAPQLGWHRRHQLFDHCCHVRFSQDAARHEHSQTEDR